MRNRLIKEEPFVTIINREWRRAKKILPVLRKKPRFVWIAGAKQSGGHSRCLGWCNRRINTIGMYHGYMNLKNHKEFVLTLRHEFAHLPETSGYAHGKDFVWWMEKLGGTRFAALSRTQIRKGTPTEAPSR